MYLLSRDFEYIYYAGSCWSFHMPRITHSHRCLDLCAQNIHPKPCATVRIIDFKSPLRSWQWARDCCSTPETCAESFVVAYENSHTKIPAAPAAAPTAVELLIKALADEMLGYILKAACLLYYAGSTATLRMSNARVIERACTRFASLFFTTYSSSMRTVGIFFSTDRGVGVGVGVALVVAA